MNSKKYEQFYSSDVVVDEVLNAIVEKIPECDLYIDPSAGDGSVIEKVKNLRSNSRFLAFDICPPKTKSKLVQKFNFESEEAQQAITNAIVQYEITYSRPPLVCVVSNPPFAKINNWLKLVSLYADHVVFLAPMQFFRLANQKQIPAVYQLRWQKQLKDAEFDHCRQSQIKPSVLQVWSIGISPATEGFVSSLTAEKLGIEGEWRFETLKGFNSIKDEQRSIKIRLNRKTGQIWKITGIQDVRKYWTPEPEKIRKTYAEATTLFIVCKNNKILAKLVRTAKLLDKFKSSFQGCSRNEITQLEFLWAYMRLYHSGYWKDFIDDINNPVQRAADDPTCEFSEFDLHLFRCS